MTRRIDLGRRRRLRAALALALGALAAPLAAQDPRGVEAQRAARDWLELADRLDTQGSWEAADAKFRTVMPPDKWAAALKQARGALGAVEQRTLVSTRFVKSFPGYPDGDYAILVFRSVFARKTGSQETLMLERDGSGTWRVVGYSIA